jgi:hypothetical protein
VTTYTWRRWGGNEVDSRVAAIALAKKVRSAMTGATMVPPADIVVADRRLDVALDIVSTLALSDNYRLGMAAQSCHIPAPCVEDTPSWLAAGRVQHTLQAPLAY